MQKKRLTHLAIALGLAAAVAVGGCSKSKDEKTVQGGGQAEAPQAAAPANHSTLISDLKARLAEKPNDPDITQHLANTYFDLKQFNEAIVYYKKLIELRPQTDVYNDLGLSLHYLGNTAEGLKYVDEGIKKDPYHQRIWLTKGFLMAYGMGDLEGAKAAWEKAKALNPESQIGKAASEFLAQFEKKK